MSVRAAISNLYATNPRAANAFTGGCTFALGDLMAQRLEMARGSDNSSAKRDLRERTSTTTTAEQERNRSYDFYRAAQLGLLGVVMNGVFLYTWIGLLDRRARASLALRPKSLPTSLFTPLSPLRLSFTSCQSGSTVMWRWRTETLRRKCSRSSSRRTWPTVCSGLARILSTSGLFLCPIVLRSRPLFSLFGKLTSRTPRMRRESKAQALKL